MMRLSKVSVLVPLAAALALAACATAPPTRTEVTRFHLGQPIPSDSVVIVAPAGVDVSGLEFRSRAAVVAEDLARVGFRAVPPNAGSAYVAVLTIREASREGPPRSSPFQIGLGGATGGRSGGVGGGLTLPIGKAPSSQVNVNEVGVQIRRRSDNSTVWEGRVVEEIAADKPGSSMQAALPALSRALFADFPGPSGQTVRVKLPK